MLMFWFQYCHLGKFPELLRWETSAPTTTYISYRSCYLHVFRRAHGYGWMHFARSGQLQDLIHDIPLWLRPPWMGWYFKTFCHHSPHDGMLLQDLLWLSQSAQPLSPPQHTHAHTITETTSHKQSNESMLYLLQLQIQEIHFQNAIHFNILVSTGIAHGANYKALLEIFLLENLK